VLLNQVQKIGARDGTAGLFKNFGERSGGSFEIGERSGINCPERIKIIGIGNADEIFAEREQKDQRSINHRIGFLAAEGLKQVALRGNAAGLVENVFRQSNVAGYFDVLLGGGAQLGKRSFFDLADAFAGNAVGSADRFESLFFAVFEAKTALNNIPITG
jgi:hypothetical protein